MDATNLVTQLVGFLHRTRGERGASLTEYALLVGLIAAACIGAIEFLGDAAAIKLSAVGESIGQP